MFTKKSLFTKIVSKCFQSFKTRSQTTKMAELHKSCYGVKNVKRFFEMPENCLEAIFVTNTKTKCVVQKRPKSIKAGQAVQKSKIGQKAKKLLKLSINRLKWLSWPGSEKKSSTKKFFSSGSSKTLQITKNTLWNARNGQNVQKLKIDPKRWKQLKTTENCLGMTFVTKYQKIGFWRKIVFMSKFFSKRFKIN